MYILVTRTLCRWRRKPPRRERNAELIEKQRKNKLRRSENEQPDKNLRIQPFAGLCHNIVLDPSKLRRRAGFPLSSGAGAFLCVFRGVLFQLRFDDMSRGAARPISVTSAPLPAPKVIPPSQAYIAHIGRADARLMSWSVANGLACEAVLDAFFWKSKSGKPSISNTEAFQSSDPTLDHAAVRVILREEQIGDMPPLGLCSILS